MKRPIVAIFLMICNISLGQSSVLDRYINEGLESNLSLKEQNIELEKALVNIEIAKANKSPKIVFAPTYSLAAGGRSLNFPIGDLLNPVYNTLNKLTQSKNFPEVQNVNQLLAPNNFHDTKFTVQMPIFNSDIKYGILINKELYESEKAKQKYLEFELRYQISLAYLQVLQSKKAIDIYEKAKNTLEEAVVFNETLYKNKVVLKDALFTAQYEVLKMEQNINVAKKNNLLAEAYFNFLINKTDNNAIEYDSTITNQKPSLASIDYYQNEALINRPEFLQINSAKNASFLNYKRSIANAKLPQAFVGTNSGFQGYGYKFSHQAYYVAQIGLNWELFHGFEKKAKIQLAKLNTSVLDLKILASEKKFGQKK